ncbi:hypothetical protein N0V83_003820 [Neocucurbitaria cava]|uniref:Hypervirulence associated protein TUDOR domain-containing protein n=1 Tax=Neocucurbitaria cava TaxID=798079 RepID=A0A9W8YA63_9PLEO|nr:hypothetical protein N0V83_003820 [Neocucurbitaria cava]
MPSRNGDNAAALREQGKAQVEHVSKTAKSDESRAAARKDARGADKKDAADCTQHWEDAEHMEKNQAEYKKFLEDNRRTAKEQKNASGDENGDTDEGGKKRGRGANAASTDTSNKKQKQTNNGNGTQEKDDEPTATGGDKTRLPAAGQKVQWKADAGVVDGEVVEVVLGKKTVEGKKVEASKEDPKVVVKSNGDGEVSVLGSDEVYFD